MLFRRIDGLLGDSYLCRVPQFLFLYRLDYQETGLANSFCIERFRVNLPNVYNALFTMPLHLYGDKQKMVKIYIFLIPETE